MIPINVYYILKRGCLDAYLYFIFQELKTVCFWNASVVFSVLHIHVHRGGNMHLKIKKEMNYYYFDNKYLVFQELAIDIFTSSSFCNFGNIGEKRESACERSYCWTRLCSNAMCVKYSYRLSVLPIICRSSFR